MGRDAVVSFLEKVQKAHLRGNGLKHPYSLDLHTQQDELRAPLRRYAAMPENDGKKKRFVDEGTGLVQTEWQDPMAYLLLNYYLQELEKIKPHLHHSFPKLQRGRPLVGTVCSQELNAEVRSHDGKYTLIMVSEGMLHFASRLVKILARVMFLPDGRLDETIQYRFVGDTFEWELDRQAETHFYDLTMACLLGYGPVAAKSCSPKWTYPEEVMARGFESFVIAHEYAHFWLGHINEPQEVRQLRVKNVEYSSFVHSHQEEVNADGTACVATMLAGHLQDSKPYYDDLLEFGMLACLKTMEQLEKMEKFKNGLTDDAALPVSTHPPAYDRRVVLSKLLCNRPGDPYKEVRHIVFCGMLDTLWIRFKMFFEMFKTLLQLVKVDIEKAPYPLVQRYLYGMMEYGVPWKWTEATMPDIERL